MQFWQARKIPLAWLLLTRQPMRLAVALAGIGFAGLLMFIQLGFRDALFDSSVTVHKMFDTDLVLLSPRTTSSIRMASFPRRRLAQAMANPAVVDIVPVHWDFALWRNPENKSNRPILALAYEPGHKVFLDEKITDQSSRLTQRGRVLFDELSRNEFGPVPEWFRQGRTVETEAAGKRLRVAGLFSAGPSFGADGTILLSNETFLNLFPNAPPGSIELGLIRLRNGSDPTKVRDQLRRLLPNDVSVLTKQGFMDMEINYWRTSTAIGFIFGLGAAMGFVVGCVIVYQILYSDVSDHLPEYATLMAMGYNLFSLVGVVAREGFLLALIGYLPALGVSNLLYIAIKSATKLPVLMIFDRALLVFVMILVMCMGSAALAMRRLGDADPAEIF
ncbi:ABC transporter permease DevC [Synechococcus sp. CCY 9618]|uniref:ABC transporter permease DevC n=1 Tax=Synechococcus sp. CCY 9618 TaxID=2815602 RepID=UPI001C23A10E|nr:ABC transporter permease DevC [Synechococcus sp. CCY 9618]